MQVSLETGVQDALERTRLLTISPRLIAVYGFPGAGKSFFLRQFALALYQQGFTAHCGGYPNEAETYLPFILKKDVLCFHLGYDISQDKNPALYNASMDTFRYLGRPVDLNIAIYNPAYHQAPRSKRFIHPQKEPTFKYDIIIRNSHSSGTPLHSIQSSANSVCKSFLFYPALEL